MCNLNAADEKGGGAGCSRRDFMGLVGVALGALALGPANSQAAEVLAYRPPLKAGAKVRVAFIYPPTASFTSDPKAWWSWPGVDYDAEGHQQRYTAELHKIEKKLGLTLQFDPKNLTSAADMEQLAKELAEQKPDALVLFIFYNFIFADTLKLIDAASKAQVPTILYSDLGVHHGSVKSLLQRPGLYFIQSRDNFEAIEGALRMVNARKVLPQSVLLRIFENAPSTETVEPFLGIRARGVPFAQYAEIFHKVELDAPARQILKDLTANARSIYKVTPEALENAMRAHLALRTLLMREQADSVTMNCLRQGMLKPCISFSLLNGDLIPATCENDIQAAYGQMLGQLITGRGGFQHNPCFDTERNTYYASHCTCTPRLHGPDAPPLPYMLRRFLHTNEGSCAIQTFWQPGDPVTMIHYYPGEPPKLDVYAGKVVASHDEPSGCTTNVELALTDREDAMTIAGHHNILYCGDFAHRFKAFANLYDLALVGQAPPAPAPSTPKAAAPKAAAPNKARAKRPAAPTT